LLCSRFMMPTTPNGHGGSAGFQQFSTRIIWFPTACHLPYFFIFAPDRKNTHQSCLRNFLNLILRFRFQKKSIFMFVALPSPHPQAARGRCIAIRRQRAPRLQLPQKEQSHMHTTSLHPHLIEPGMLSGTLGCGTSVPGVCVLEALFYLFRVRKPFPRTTIHI
jgi:hypothetical protein